MHTHIAHIANFKFELDSVEAKISITIIAEHEIAAILILRAVVYVFVAVVVVVVKQVGEKDQSAAAAVRVRDCV